MIYLRDKFSQRNGAKTEAPPRDSGLHAGSVNPALDQYTVAVEDRSTATPGAHVTAAPNYYLARLAQLAQFCERHLR